MPRPTRLAPAPLANDAYRQSRRLDELTFANHGMRVNTSSSPYTAPSGFERVHTERLAATGMYVRDAVSLGEAPVPPPVPAGNGLLFRPAQAHPAFAVREDFNLPFLRPGEAFTPQDLHDFQVAKRSPTLRAVVQELEAKVANINGADPRLLGLSPLAATLLFCIQQQERRSPLGHLLGGSTANLAETGAVEAALMELTRSISRNNVFTLQALEAKGGPGAVLAQGIREAVPAQRGLQVVLHRGHFPMEPTGAEVPLTREEAASALKSNPAALDQMVAEAPIPKTLAALEAAKAQVPDRAFAGVHCIAVQHLLATNVTMFEAMRAKGLDPKATQIIGIPYSTNFVCEHALRRSGFEVNTPDVIDPSQVGPSYEAFIASAVKKAIERSVTDGKPILLIDDGGKLTTYVAKHFPQHAHRFRAVEQTTRGLTELKALPTVPMPVVDVAKSPLKQFEMPHIGQQVVSSIQQLASQIGLGGVTQKQAVVMGFGPIGQGIAKALAATGSQVTVWDPDPAARQRARVRRA